MQGQYDGANICVNGHVINPDAKRRPIHNTEFCDKCGAETIFTCLHYQRPIRGSYSVDGLTDPRRYSAPSFCTGCGKPYPWTSAALAAARELVVESDSLSSAEREELQSTFSDLVTDTPRTTVAASKYKRLAIKAGKEVASGLRDILVDVVSESVKKVIWPGA